MEMIKYRSRQELLIEAKEKGYEIYTESQVRAFQEAIVKSMDPFERKCGAIDLASIHREIVINDDLSKSVLFWRPSQIEFRVNTDPTTLLKAREGYYKDTPENRAKGIVGRPYRGRTEDVEKEKASKEISSINKMKADLDLAKKKGDKEAVKKITARIRLYESEDKEDKTSKGE